MKDSNDVIGPHYSFWSLIVMGLLSMNSRGFADTSHIPTRDYPMNGAYIGAQSGWGWSGFSVNETPVGSAAVADNTVAARSARLNGGLLGGYWGYQRYVNNWLLGVEMDADASSIHGVTYGQSQSQVAILIDGITTSTNLLEVSETNRMLASIRARFGLAYSFFTPYVTAGAAWRVDDFYGTASGNVDGGWSNDFHKSTQISAWGYAVGAGLNWKMASCWALQLDYLYEGFSSHRAASGYFSHSTPIGSGVTLSMDESGINLFRMGVSYLL